MISCIICSRHPDIPSELKENIASTIGCEYELIVIDNSCKEYSIFSAYNEGVRRAKGDILCFMHDDIISFHTNGWGLNVEKHFEVNAKLGLVGISGSHFLPNTPAEWYHCQLGSGGCIQTVDGVTENSQHLEHFENNNTILEAVIVDGMWMCIRQSLFTNIHFDIENFSGWHCYDTDICLQVINEGYKVAIISDVLLEHSSWGNLTMEWVESTKKVHAKWSHILPIVRSFEMSESEIDLRTKMIAISMNYLFTIVKQKTEIQNLRKSRSYRIGKLITNPLRKIQKIFK